MKVAILSALAATGLAVSAGTASAHPPGYGYPGFGRPVVVRPAPVVVAPVYPRFVQPVPYYGSGFNLTIGGSRGVISFGSGTVAPGYGWGRAYPYYGGWGGYGRPWWGW